MKNIIKVISILVITTFVFSVYPMEERGYPISTSHDHRIIKISNLKEKNKFLYNALLHTDDFDTTPAHCKLICEHDPMHRDMGLAFGLFTVIFLAEQSEVENKKTLKTICNIVGQGIPLTSKYYFKIANSKVYLHIFEKQKPFSIFSSLQPILQKCHDHKDKITSWMETILKKNQAREEKLAHSIHDALQSIVLLEDLILLICSLLLQDKERIAVIEKIRKVASKIVGKQITLD